jgi:hypothetical protein
MHLVLLLMGCAGAPYSDDDVEAFRPEWPS